MEFFITRDDAVKQRALEHIQSLEGVWNIEIKKHVKSKTAQQRRYWHKLLSIIADYRGMTLDEQKMEIKYKVLPLREIKMRGERYLYPPSSESLTSKQYGELIDATLLIGGALELTMPHPDYYGLNIMDMQTHE